MLAAAQPAVCIPREDTQALSLTWDRHKIVAKRGAAFTIMVAGESGLGKTTFINTLFSTTIKNYADHKRRHHKQMDKTVEIEITKAELEEKFFKGMSWSAHMCAAR